MGDGDEDRSEKDQDPAISDDEILDIFRKASDPALTASEVADELPISRRAVFYRLRKLEDQGTLRSKKTGARGTIWWYPGHTSTSKGARK